MSIVEPRRTAALSAAAVLLCVLLLGLPYAAATGATRPDKKQTIVRVAHGPVTLPLVDTPPAGPSVGDLRTVWAPLTRPRSRAAIGYLSGSLLTVAVDRPGPGQELRTSILCSSSASMQARSWLAGSPPTTATAPTVAVRSVTVRPVIGGSGTAAGATGWCRTIHHPNGTWTHVFTLTP